jgi:hypothetical protein
MQNAALRIQNGQRRFVLLQIAFWLMLGVALWLAWTVRAAPLEPAWARGLFRVDGLATCWLILTLAFTLGTTLARRPALAMSLLRPMGSTDAARCVRTMHTPPVSRLLPSASCLLLCAGYLTTHLALLAAVVFAAALVLAARRWEAWVSALLVATGLILIALRAGTWRYPAPDAGLGLNSLSFGLILCAVLLAAGAPGLLRRNTTPPLTLLAVGMLYTLYRLFSLGPWNLGWLLAALLLGAALALGAAWAAAFGPAAHMPARLATLYLALGVVGGGLASGAGLALGAFALLTLVLQQALFPLTAATPRRALWLVSGAIPLTVPFVAGWLAVAAAMAGGITALAVVVWASVLLAAAAVARIAEMRQEEAETTDDGRWSVVGGRWSMVGGRWSVVGGLSLILGVTSPAVFALLIQPMVAQLQGGLTPFGEVTLWPWAGLLALNAARQPVATLPSLALAGLMVILAALAWLATQLRFVRRRNEADAP